MNAGVGGSGAISGDVVIGSSSTSQVSLSTTTSVAGAATFQSTVSVRDGFICHDAEIF